MSEKGEIKRIGAKAHKNSGRGPIQKADASTDTFVIDIKEYEKSFSITQDVWAKITMDTIKTDKTKSPAIYLVLGGKTRLGIIEWSEIERLTEIEREYERLRNDTARTDQ